jgi:hypothetical protein
METGFLVLNGKIDLCKSVTKTTYSDKEFMLYNLIT